MRNSSNEKMKIEWVDFGIANIIGGTLYINKKLKLRPDLLDKVLVHESKHVVGNFWKNILVDVTDEIDFEMGKFVLKTPSTWVQYLPLWVWRKKIVVSYYMTLVWMVIMLIIVAGGGALWILM